MVSGKFFSHSSSQRYRLYYSIYSNVISIFISTHFIPIFRHFASGYSAKELADLVYETLYDLDQAEYYLSVHLCANYLFSLYTIFMHSIVNY